MVLRGRLNALISALCVGSSLLLLSGCTAYTPNGVTIRDGAVTAIYRPCGQAVIGRIDLFEGDDYDQPPVWSARLVDPRHGTLVMPISPTVAGYQITNHVNDGLKPSVTYVIVAQSSTSVEWDGVDFKLSDLRTGQIKTYNGYANIASWATPRQCGSTDQKVIIAIVSVLGLGNIAALIIVVNRRRRRILRSAPPV